MSDTDDTDALLLIPPNYFISNAEQILQRERREQEHWQVKENKSQAKFTECVQYINERLDIMLQDRQNYTSASDEMKLEHNNNNNQQQHQQQQESRSCNVLNQHNLSLHNSYMAVHGDGSDVSATTNRPFIMPPASDISAICHSDNQHNNNNKTQRPSDTVLCSTPKTTTPRSSSSPHTLGTLMSTLTSTTAIPMQNRSQSSAAINLPYDSNMAMVRDDQVLHEVDNFLMGRGNHNNNSNNNNNNRGPHKSTGAIGDAFSLINYQDISNINYRQQKLNHNNALETNNTLSLRLPAATEELNLQMLSLGDMWRHDMPATANNAENAQTNISMALKEEQLRRQHLEKTVHGLQVRLLEYQQRFSVAVEVDRSKNEALSTTLTNNKSLQTDLEKLGNTHQKLVREHAECGGKLSDMQRELTQAVNLAAKFEQKNDKLQQELDENIKKHKSQVSHMKEQLEELEIKYQVSKKTEENALNDLCKLKDKLVKIEHQHDKYKTHCEELEKENLVLRNQKCSLQDFHQKQKLRADALEDRGKSLQEAISKLSATEATLEKKLELQQKHLKAQYQQQLDNVVAHKLKEFQDQLDKSEESLKYEARERERLMAERAVKQLEIMHDKNEQEFVILQQKHDEEIELYRIQLANACKRIEKLEDYLNCYKSRRTEIAEQLHDVMETQWQKALEILISPARSRQSSNVDTNETQSPNDRTRVSPVTQNDQTPKSNKLQLSTEYSLNTDFNNENNNNHNSFNNMSHDICCPRQLQQQQQQQHNEQQYNSLLQRTPQAQTQTQVNNDEVMKKNRLQAYIDLLLSKSPTDVAKLDELLNNADDKYQSQHSLNDRKLTKCMKSKHNNKPPWKA